jgi:hypothetical protein
MKKILRRFILPLLLFVLAGAVLGVFYWLTTLMKDWHPIPFLALFLPMAFVSLMTTAFLCFYAFDKMLD